ncbi:MAG: YigZ family protein [Clostridiales bacterium]|jgi:uncharacterized YigZ family protein|nr:YigZ family protein [Clostridiales bacterium]
MTNYFTPAGYGEAEHIEKKSRFIARIWPVKGEDEALDKIRQMREKHWDASHNVYAYILRENSIMRYSDDGEPQGTSGLPVLNVFKSAGVYDACCVVTRYFGGILLGTGGLARAYSKSASLALDAAGIGTVRKWLKIEIECAYHLYERIRNELSLKGAAVSDTQFGAQVVIKALLPEDGSDGIEARLQELSSGTVSINILGEDFLFLNPD